MNSQHAYWLCPLSAEAIAGKAEGMTHTALTQRRYDHRLKCFVQKTGNIAIATECGIPASTARGWLTQSRTEVVSLELFDLNTTQLQQEVIKLRRQIAKLTSVLRLVIVVLQVSGFSLRRWRVSDGRDKKRLLRVIQRTRSHVALRTIGGCLRPSINLRSRLEADSLGSRV